MTAIRFNNGFFIQSPDDEADADSSTSEGIFVFTSSVPPADAAVGNRVRVSGTVAEFLADAGSLTATEIISPAVVMLSTGNALPSAIALTSADTNPGGPLDQLEPYEGMRVHVETLNVVAPTQGSVNEVTAIGSTNGVYYGVIPNVARPFRQPGIELPLPLPPGSPCCVTRFDGNPERIRVDSNGNAAFAANQTTEVMTGATVSGITGVLDYSAHAYTILPDFGAQGVVAETHGYSAVLPIAAHRFTIATANLERFFDTVDTAGISDVALNANAYQLRLTKVGLQICDVMRAPDIIGVEEVENVTVLQNIAAAANSTPSCNGTNYTAYLFEGNDPGGIDDGFLVNLNRVVVRDVHQEGKDTTFIDPTDGSVDVLNDLAADRSGGDHHVAGRRSAEHHRHCEPFAIAERYRRRWAGRRRSARPRETARPGGVSRHSHRKPATGKRRGTGRCGRRFQRLRVQRRLRRRDRHDQRDAGAGQSGRARKPTGAEHLDTAHRSDRNESNGATLFVLVRWQRAVAGSRARDAGGVRNL